MARYLIESPHSEQECLMILKQILAAGYLTHMEWGCESGQHCGWVIIEAENETEARMVLPSLVRNKARVVKLVKFGPDDIQRVESLHKKI